LIGAIVKPRSTSPRPATTSATSAKTSAGSVTVRNMSSLEARSGTTFALRPPVIVPML
jgi:hypothetical protein